MRIDSEVPRNGTALGDRWGSRSSNLFDVLRIVAAALVIVGHAWPLTGTGGVPTYAGIRIHHLGVYVFFAISGFLLATSWERQREAVPFFARRCLRIFPALILVVLVTLAVIGPWATTLSASAYWTSSETWSYLQNVILLGRYDLPGVFETNPESAVNGSLWSLGVEFSCYLGLVATAVLAARVRNGIRVGLCFAAVLGSAFQVFHGPLRTTAIAVAFFLAGSLLAQSGTLVRWPIWPAVIALMAIAPTRGFLGQCLALVVVPYAAVAIGSRRSRLAAAVHRLGDPTYGMYLWGFPLQQLATSLVSATVGVSIAIVLPAALLLGYASWWSVELPAVRLGVRPS